MRASAWLVLEIEERRTYSRGEYKLKIARVRQTQPLNEIAVKVILEVPDEVIMPKVEALVEFESQLVLEIEEVEEVEEEDELDGLTDRLPEMDAVT